MVNLLFLKHLRLATIPNGVSALKTMTCNLGGSGISHCPTTGYKSVSNQKSSKAVCVTALITVT